MSRIQIKHRITGAVLFEGEYPSLKACVIAAMKAGAYLTGANLAGAYLTGAYLTGANLTGANLTDANLAGANLAGAYLTGANLAGANLTDANLAGANLAGANLTGAYLTGANLAGAYLTGANLAGADLTGANLTDAYLTDANLTGADLTDANLTDAQGIGETNGSEVQQQEPANRAERDAARAARFRERNPDVPVVESLDAKILAAIDQGGHLDMSDWHKCDTTHCRAGWAITLAGAAGASLEAKYGPHRAGMMIYSASTGRVPHFFADDSRALEDIQEQAALQEQKS